MSGARACGIGCAATGPADRRDAADRARSGAGAEICAPGGGDSPRRKAGESPADRRRLHPGRRFRDRARRRSTARTISSPSSVWRWARRPIWRRSSRRARSRWTPGPISTVWPRPATRCSPVRRRSRARPPHELIVRRFTMPVPSVRDLPSRGPRRRWTQALRRALALKPGDRFACIADVRLGARGWTPADARRRGGIGRVDVGVVLLLAGVGLALLRSLRGSPARPRCPARRRARDHPARRPPVREPRRFRRRLLRRRDRGRGPRQARAAVGARGDRAVQLQPLPDATTVTRGDRSRSRREVPADRHRALGEASRPSPREFA